MEDLTGKQLGPYQIVSALGEGGMAAVYRAYQPGVDRYVALKILPQQFAKDQQFVARFEQEAKVLAQLQHPNILPVFDYGESNGYTFIAMPLIKSGTLSHMLNGEPLEYKLIRRVISQVGDALDYAHSSGLIHRDVKPSNVLVDERGNCLLTDFGLAKILEGNANRLTTSGAVMGTPVYMSPEQGMGKLLDRRSDVYSLGVILYEMAVGRAPYDAETPMAVVFKHINDPLPPPSTLTHNFPDVLERVVLKALAKNPDDRFQSAGAMVAALEQAMGQVEKSGATRPVKKTNTAIPRANRSTPAFGTQSTPGSRPPQTTRLLKQAWWALPLLGVTAVIALMAIAALGLLAINMFPRATTQPTQPEVTHVATEAGIETEAVPTTAPTSGAIATQPPAPVGGDLLVEDFEDGEAQGWVTTNGQASVVELADGNQVYALEMGPFGGAYAVYAPAWEWPPDEGYVFEAEVMTEEVEVFSTGIQLLARLVDSAPAQACLGYFAELGAGWARAAKQGVAGGDCENGEWTVFNLAPEKFHELGPGEWHHLKLAVQDMELQYYLDDMLVASVSDFRGTYQQGGIGVAMANSAKVYIDNVHVQSLAGQPLTDRETATWSVLFTRDFPPDFWSAGDHEYTLTMDCPNLPQASATVSQTFTVSNSLEPPAEGSYIILGADGAQDAIQDGAAVSAFHPANNTVIVYKVEDLTHANASASTVECRGAVSWDGGAPEPLEPLMMFQQP